MIRLIKSKSELFLEKRQNSWHDLRTIILKNGKKKLDDKEIFEFPRLYRQACTDLEEARRRKLSPDVIQFLTELTSRANRILYSAPVLRKKTVFQFFLVDYPKLMIKSWLVLLIAFLLFFGPMAASALIVNLYPDAATAILGQSTLDQYVSMHDQPHEDKRSPGMNATAVAWYIRNNVNIAFVTFASGILFGSGTVFFLFYNGMSMGTVFAHLTLNGYGMNILSFVTAHAPFELLGIVYAGAAGLKLASGLIRGLRISRQQALKQDRDQVVLLLLSAAAFIASAAFIEGIISPQAIPFFMRATIAFISLLLVISYTFILPLIWRKK